MLGKSNSTQILPNISSRKSNQATKIDQLRECNMTNIFLEKSYTRCGGETIPKPYSKNSKSRKSQGQFYKSFIQFVFIVCKFGSYRNILKLNSRPLVFTS